MLTILGGLAALLVGGGGILTFVPGVGFIGKLLTVRDFAKRNPRKVAVALGILAAIGGFVFHQVKAGSAIKAAEKRGEARADARHKAELERLTAKAIEIRRKAEAVSSAITKQERDKYETDVRRIGAIADALRMHGPGRAACAVVGGDPALSGGAGGREPTGRSGGAPSNRVSYPDGLLLGVPYQWAVNTAEQCDLNRAEALTWREHDRRQREAWERMLAEGAKK